MTARTPTTRLKWFFFWLLALIGGALFFVPALIIRPFSYQSPRGLWLAMSVRQQAPWATLAAAVVGLLIVVSLWQETRLWGKAALCLGTLLVLFSAAMSRMNYFEWMFHPAGAPGFESASLVKLSKDEMVMAVHLGDDERAYPIRQMAYHHVLNDIVDGIPVAVTY